MSWRKWRLGAAVAIATGLFEGLTALGVGTPWKGALLLLAISMGKDFLLWSKDHPADQVSFDTEQLKKE